MLELGLGDSEPWEQGVPSIEKAWHTSALGATQQVLVRCQSWCPLGTVGLQLNDIIIALSTIIHR
jgi:hypothetical protein